MGDSSLESQVELTEKNSIKKTQNPIKHASCCRSTPPKHVCREGATQEEATRAIAEQLLHGRQVPGLLQDQDGFQPRTDRRSVPRLQRDYVSANRRQGSIDYWLQFPKEG